MYWQWIVFVIAIGTFLNRGRTARQPSIRYRHQPPSILEMINDRLSLPLR